MLATTKLVLLHHERGKMVQNPDDTAGNIPGGLCMCSAMRTLLIQSLSATVVRKIEGHLSLTVLSLTHSFRRNIKLAGKKNYCYIVSNLFFLAYVQKEIYLSLVSQTVLLGRPG